MGFCLQADSARFLPMFSMCVPRTLWLGHTALLATSQATLSSTGVRFGSLGLPRGSPLGYIPGTWSRPLVRPCYTLLAQLAQLAALPPLITSFSSFILLIACCHSFPLPPPSWQGGGGWTQFISHLHAQRHRNKTYNTRVAMVVALNTSTLPIVE